MVTKNNLLNINYTYIKYTQDQSNHEIIIYLKNIDFCLKFHSLLIFFHSFQKVYHLICYFNSVLSIFEQFILFIGTSTSNYLLRNSIPCWLSITFFSISFKVSSSTYLFLLFSVIVTILQMFSISVVQLNHWFLALRFCCESKPYFILIISLCN